MTKRTKNKVKEMDQSANIDLVVLADMGTWSPEEQDWGEPDEELEDWAKAIIAHGPRPSYEMEMIVEVREKMTWPGDS